MKNLKIKCPECESTFDLDNALVNQFHQSIKKDLQSELHKREEELEEQKKELITLTEQFKKDKVDFDAMVNNQVKTQLKSRED
ncbi:hypothetical protein GCM10009118_07880 [Wandonia haliotis]|uniref:DUF2130 domain-containing protein n=1 Tax=Wandonia haliotis TaxID=574963 RepID=A0ABN1MMB0_9FLAO